MEWNNCFLCLGERFPEAVVPTTASDFKVIVKYLVGSSFQSDPVLDVLREYEDNKTSQHLEGGLHQFCESCCVQMKQIMGMHQELEAIQMRLIPDLKKLQQLIINNSKQFGNNEVTKSSLMRYEEWVREKATMSANDGKERKLLENLYAFQNAVYQKAKDCTDLRLICSKSNVNQVESEMTEVKVEDISEVSNDGDMFPESPIADLSDNTSDEDYLPIPISTKSKRRVRPSKNKRIPKMMSQLEEKIIPKKKPKESYNTTFSATPVISRSIRESMSEDECLPIPKSKKRGRPLKKKTRLSRNKRKPDIIPFIGVIPKIEAEIPTVQPEMETFESEILAVQHGMETCESEIPAVQHGRETCESESLAAQPGMKTCVSEIPRVQLGMETCKSESETPGAQLKIFSITPEPISNHTVAKPPTKKRKRIRKKVVPAERAASLALPSFAVHPINLPPHRRSWSQLSCTLCNFRTKTSYSFEEHVKDHEKEIPVKSHSCDQCSQTFSTALGLELHTSFHGGFLQMHCEVCKERVCVLEGANHMKTHSENIFSCTNCSFCCVSREKYIVHIRKHGTGCGKFPCDICPLVYNRRKELLDHLDSAHQVLPKYPCPGEGCDKSYVDPLELRNHVKIHTNPVPCTVCAKPFPDNKQMQRHRQSHLIAMGVAESKKTVKCPKCSDTFHNHDNLRCHMVREHGAEKQKCEQCGVEYASKSALNYHRRVYHDGTGISCPVCERKFPIRRDLQRHMVVHSDQKEHVCAECGAQFKRPERLKNHMEIHENKKSHICNECGKAFNCRRYLMLHMKVHKDDRAFVCEVCGKGFKLERTLRVHKRSHNDIDSPRIIVSSVSKEEME